MFILIFVAVFILSVYLLWKGDVILLERFDGTRWGVIRLEPISAISNTISYTLSFSFKTTRSSSYLVLTPLNDGVGLHIYFRRGNKVVIKFTREGGESQMVRFRTTVNDGRWHTITVKVSNANLTGTLDTTTKNIRLNKTFVKPTSYYIGGLSTLRDKFIFNGLIGDLNIDGTYYITDDIEWSSR